MVGFAAQRAVPRKGRCIALFGAPGVGTSTVARCLCDASKSTTAVVVVDDGVSDATIAEIRDRQRFADVIFIDCVRSADDVKMLVIEHVVDGADRSDRLVQVMGNLRLPEIIAAEWHPRRKAIEDAIFTYSLPYHTLHNEPNDLEAAVAELARIARLRS